jgi:NAD(P) transhydrogenase subunit alpha
LCAALVTPPEQEKPPMKVAIIKERREYERRVAASPDSVKRLLGMGLTVAVENGAGAGAYFSDAAYAAAGAEIAADAAGALAGADIVLKVQRPLIGGADDELGLLPRGAVLVGLLQPLQNRADVEAYARAGLSAFALDLLPRITRAQAMDALSSQANLAGYRAVLDAASEFGRALPMMMTAAGTIKAARVLVMGAGVAGLQAIATARRLGAVVSATDVRAATKEQVESLGATFIAIEGAGAEAAETAGGYAREMGEDYVDLAVEAGGNVEGSRPGEIVTTANGVKIVGHLNVPSRVAIDASQLYARNLLAFLSLIVVEGRLRIDTADEIIKATLLTRDGEIVNPALGAAGVAA